MIVQHLLKIQNKRGYLPREELEELARGLALPLYRINEVASFFPHFRIYRSAEEEQREVARLPDYEVAVCRDMACRLRGSAEYLTQLQSAARQYGDKVSVCGVSCLGRCDRAPAVRITHGGHNPSGHAGEPASAHGEFAHGHDVRALLGRPLPEVLETLHTVVAGRATAATSNDTDAALALHQPAESWRIDCYRGAPRDERYAAVRRLVACLATPAGGDAERDRIIEALKTANLLGMGGAGGRAYLKWMEVRKAIGERKYVVCNGDESEPGTFKDRELFLRTPHLVVEGVILAGLLVGATKGYIYIRHEYEEAIAAVEREIDIARQAGMCGPNVLNSGIVFELEAFVSPGGYICGEQTALIQAIQDERGEPRNRPPELQTNGLWNMPTLLNNVETFAWVPAIVTQGAGDGSWYVEQGASAAHKGARFFSVSGDVKRPGVYEVPIGVPLRTLIEDCCGGIVGDKPIKALALSGPSGGFLPPKLPLESFSPSMRESVQKLTPAGATEFDLLDLPLDLAVTRGLRLMLGAAIIVYADGADMVDQTLACSRFYQAESCGKCVPCRIGSTKIVEMCEDLADGKVDAARLTMLNDKRESPILALSQAMADTAICGLGTSVANPLKSLLAFFPEEVQKHVRP